MRRVDGVECEADACDFRVVSGEALELEQVLNKVSDVCAVCRQRLALAHLESSDGLSAAVAAEAILAAGAAAVAANREEIPKLFLLPTNAKVWRVTRAGEKMNPSRASYVVDFKIGGLD